MPRTTYYTQGRRFRIFQEPYPPKRWFVNEADGDDWDDAHPADGFKTLKEAREHLAKGMEKMNKEVKEQLRAAGLSLSITRIDPGNYIVEVTKFGWEPALTEVQELGPKVKSLFPEDYAAAQEGPTLYVRNRDVALGIRFHTTRPKKQVRKDFGLPVEDRE